MRSLIYPTAVAFLVEALLHFMPWNRLLGRELEPPWTYAVGVSPLAILLTIWLWTERPDPVWAIWGYWAITGAGGLGCLLGYALDSTAAARLLKKFGGKDEADCAD